MAFTRDSFRLDPRQHLPQTCHMLSGSPVSGLFRSHGRPPTDALIDTYTAPAATGGKSWKDARDKAANIVAQMTNEERLGLVAGQNGRCAGNTLAVERLGLPSLCLLDGPNGPRFAEGITQVSISIASIVPS